MAQVVSERLVADAPMLRRVALLVMRAGEDDDALRQPMLEIRTVIEQLKKDVVLGVPLGHDKVARLGSLIDRLTRKHSRRPIEGAILAELRDLGRVLCRGIAG